METLLSLVGTVAAIVGTVATIVAVRRTPKLKKEPEPFTPTCTTILGADMNRHIGNLPAFQPGMP